MTRYLILLRCYRNLQDRLEFGERQRVTTDYEPTREFYAHEDKRIRDEMKRIRELAEKEGLRITDKIEEGIVPSSLENWLKQNTKKIGGNGNESN